MNAKKRFTINGKRVNEREFIMDTFLTCYILHNSLCNEDVHEMDIACSLDTIKLLRSHLVKLDGLNITEVEAIKIDHLTKYSNYCEEILLNRKSESDKFRNTLIGITVAIFAAILIWFFT